MKHEKKLLILFAFLFIFSFSICFSTEEKIAHLRDILNKEFKIHNTKIDLEDFDYENFKTEKFNVAGSVCSKPGMSEGCRQCGSSRMIVAPFSQNMVYVNGALCQVSYYQNSYILTVFEGARLGFQYIIGYNGCIQSINPYFIEEIAAGGISLRHEYSDCSILTGQDQVILFY